MQVSIFCRLGLKMHIDIPFGGFWRVKVARGHSRSSAVSSFTFPHFLWWHFQDIGITGIFRRLGPHNVENFQECPLIDVRKSELEKNK